MNINLLIIKIITKLKDHCYYTGKCRGAAYSICNLKYSVSKEIAVVFTMNQIMIMIMIIIKWLAKEFGREFNCLRTNTEQYKTFPDPITKEAKRIRKNRKETTKTISYKLQFIDSARFMASSLSNFVGNPAEEVRKIKCNY